LARFGIPFGCFKRLRAAPAVDFPSGVDLAARPDGPPSGSFERWIMAFVVACW